MSSERLEEFQWYIRSHKKTSFHPPFRKYIFRKTTAGEGGVVKLTPTVILELDFHRNLVKIHN